jgi:hypothetical protein
MKQLFLPVILLVCLPAIASPQSVMSAHSLIEAEQQHGSSGTSIEPSTTPVPMLMTDHGPWRLMLNSKPRLPETAMPSSPPTGSCPWPSAASALAS